MSAQIEKYLGLDIIQQIPQKINDMTTSLVDDLTEKGGSLEEVKSNLRTALDNINGQFDEISTTVDDLADTLDTNMEAIENAEAFRKGIFLAIASLIIAIGLCGLFGILFPSSSCGLIMLRASIALRKRLLFEFWLFSDKPLKSNETTVFYSASFLWYL